jgi:hypothetical protein
MPPGNLGLQKAPSLSETLGLSLGLQTAVPRLKKSSLGFQKVPHQTKSAGPSLGLQKVPQLKMRSKPSLVPMHQTVPSENRQWKEMRHIHGVVLKTISSHLVSLSAISAFKKRKTLSLTLESQKAIRRLVSLHKIRPHLSVVLAVVT